MGAVKQYTPILRTKMGELKALEMIIPQDKLYPLLVIPEKKSSNLYFVNLAKAWPHNHLPILVDARIYQDQSQITIFDDIKQKSKISIIPVTDPYCSDYYKLAVKDAIGKNNNRFCLYLLGSFFSYQDLLSVKIPDIIDFFGVPPQNIDIIIDLLDIKAPPQYLYPWLQKVLPALYQIGSWRSMILAGTAFPPTSQIPVQSAMQACLLSRWDWELWTMVAADQNLPPVGFADYTCLGIPYAISFPKVAPKIRYATGNEWLYIRGNANQYSQYYDLARMVCQSPYYKGQNFSWGDFCLYEKSQNIGTTGGATTWVSVDVNHHINVVLSQI